MDPASYNVRHAQPPAAPREAQELASDNLLQIVWHSRWIVAGVTAAFLGLAVLYLLIAPPKYTARARLFVEQTGPRILSDQGRVERKSTSFLGTQAEMIASMPILADAMKRAGATRAFAGVDDPITRLQKDLAVSVGKQDEIITVALELRSAEEATRIVQAIVDSYVAGHAESNRSTATELVKLLRKEKAQREQEMDALQREMTAFQRANGAISLDSNFELRERLTRLGDALTAAQVQAHEARAAYDAAQQILASTDGINQLIEAQQVKGINAMDHEYGDLLDSRARLESDLAQLEQRWGSDHRNVRTARAAVDSINLRIDEKRRRFAIAHLAELQRRVEAAASMLTQLQVAYAQTKDRAAELGEKVTEHERMKAALTQLGDQRATLDRRIQELSVSEDAGALNINVLEPASADSKPTSPRRLQTLGAALIAGILLGVFLAVIRDWMDQRFRSAEQIHLALGLRVLALIPGIRGRRSDQEIGQIVHMDPTSAAAEAVRDIRTAIQFSRRHAPLRSLVIASACPNEGKTSVASNLAIALAQAGQRVLLIDADMRNPSLHAIFQFDNHVGLSMALTGKTPFKEAIQRTAVEHLDFLPAGPVPHNPSEILNSQTLIATLESLSERYDLVLLDSPPVMSVTDTRILSAICDAAMLVVRPAASDRRMVHAAFESLAAVGARVIGVVANDVPADFGLISRRYYGSAGAPRPLHPEIALETRSEQPVAPAGR